MEQKNNIIKCRLLKVIDKNDLFCGNESIDRVIFPTSIDWWELSQEKFRELAFMVEKANNLMRTTKRNVLYFLIEAPRYDDAFNEVWSSAEEYNNFVKSEELKLQEKKRRRLETNEKNKLEKKRAMLEKLKKEFGE